jgi:hypothetical protein
VHTSVSVQGLKFMPLSGYGGLKVPGAQVSVKEKFFLRGMASYKAKSSD